MRTNREFEGKNWDPDPYLKTNIADHSGTHGGLILAMVSKTFKKSGTKTYQVSIHINPPFKVESAIL